ncbi:MAG: SAM-dependent DNA methyltransferase [Bacteroidetes bacterium]|nr:SAM-dependent DNA methyltransferase [Bacteroidota bacterium]
MNRMASQHGVHSMFSDLLDLLIYTFSGERKEKEYLELIRKYEKPDAYTISEAMAALLVEMTGDGNGMVDVLGNYFEENLYFDKNRQLFTPQNTCDRMVRIQNPIQAMECITDLDCGSGRMLMAMAKVNRVSKFYGADNDANYAKIAVINLCLNKMYGEIAWMDSLSNQFFGGWVIEHTIKGIPRIREITKRESYIHLKLPSSSSTVHLEKGDEERSDGGGKSVTSNPKNVTDIQEIETIVQKNDTTQTLKQQVLFEF